jgi:hypothetical protein
VTLGPGSDRLERGKIEVLLDPAHARLELADQNAMADDRGMVFDYRAAQPDDLLAQLLAGRKEIGGDIGAQRMEVGSDIGAERVQVGFRRMVCANLADVRPTSPSSARISRRSSRMRLSGCSVMAPDPSSFADRRQRGV